MKFKTKEEFITRIMAGDRFTKVNSDLVYYYDSNEDNPFRYGEFPLSGNWEQILIDELTLVEPEPIIERRWKMLKDYDNITKESEYYHNQASINKKYNDWYKGSYIDVKVKG